VLALVAPPGEASRDQGIPLRQVLRTMEAAGFGLDADAEVAALGAKGIIHENERGAATVLSPCAVADTLARAFAMRDSGDTEGGAGADETPAAAVMNAVLRPVRFATPQPPFADGSPRLRSPHSDSEAGAWDPYVESNRERMLVALEVLSVAVSAGLARGGACDGGALDPADPLVAVAARLVKRYTAVCPEKQSPWNFSGLNTLATVVSTEQIVWDAGTPIGATWIEHSAELAHLGLEAPISNVASPAGTKPTRSISTMNAGAAAAAAAAAADGEPRPTSRRTSMSSVSLCVPRQSADAYGHRMRHAGPDFRPGGAHVSELVWRLAVGATVPPERTWATMVPVARVAVLARRPWAAQATAALADALMECGRFRHALHFATVALATSEMPGQAVGGAGVDAIDAAAASGAPPSAAAPWVAACRIVVAGCRLCLGASHRECVAAATADFESGLLATPCPAEMRARARFRIAAMHLWGGEYEPAKEELIDMHRESVVLRESDELMAPADGVATATAASVCLALAELFFAQEDDSDAAATFANHAIQVLESGTRHNEALSDLATAFVARLARADDRLDDAAGLMSATACRRADDPAIAFERALIDLARGEGRLARRGLARLKTQIAAAPPPQTFWPLPLVERWPNIAVEFVEIALLAAHENVLSVGPAAWRADDGCDECTLCRQEFTFMTRKHHCRACGEVVCDECSQHREYLSQPARDGGPGDDVPCTLQRICDACKADFMALESASTMSRMTAAF